MITSPIVIKECSSGMLPLVVTRAGRIYGATRSTRNGVLCREIINTWIGTETVRLTDKTCTRLLSTKHLGSIIASRSMQTTRTWTSACSCKDRHLDPWNTGKHYTGYGEVTAAEH